MIDCGLLASAYATSWVYATTGDGWCLYCSVGEWEDHKISPFPIQSNTRFLCYVTVICLRKGEMIWCSRCKKWISPNIWKSYPSQGMDWKRLFCWTTQVHPTLQRWSTPRVNLWTNSREKTFHACTISSLQMLNYDYCMGMHTCVLLNE